MPRAGSSAPPMASSDEALAFLGASLAEAGSGDTRMSKAVRVATRRGGEDRPEPERRRSCPRSR